MGNPESDFKMLKPITITPAMLMATNVPEAVAQTWVSTTTYALDDLAGVAPIDGSPQGVYKSLQAANLNHALTDTAWWEQLGIVYPDYNAAVSYNTGDTVSSNHKLYESLTTGNLGNAVADTLSWLDVGATNLWTMFDPTYGSQTTNADSITLTLQPNKLLNTVYLGNLDAASVTITQVDSGFSETILLSSHPVLDWYSWYYTTIFKKEDIAITGIPPYSLSALNITINNQGGTAKLGIMLAGESVILGKTSWGVRGSLLSYSGTTTDTFGNTTFLKRANAKRLELDVYMLEGYEDVIFRLLTKYADMPMLFIGSSSYQLTMSYAYLGAWEIPINVGTSKPMSIELRGLI